MADVIPMTDHLHAEVCRDQIAEAEEQISALVTLSEALYQWWEPDAAFYTLRAAASLVVTPDQVARVRAIAVARRDEHLTAPDGVTAANHGCATSDWGTDPHDRDTYAQLVRDLDRTVYARQTPGDDFWRSYGWRSRKAQTPTDGDDTTEHPCA